MSSGSYDVCVLGAGAAGLMTALTAAARGKRVLLLEHAKHVGKKILMSGGGRCNFTNIGTTPAQFLGANKHFCKSALSRFPPSAFIEMVRAAGISFHEKELGQLFCDSSSKQIVQMLLQCCEAVELRIDCKIHEVKKTELGYRVSTSQGSFASQTLVVATGGLSIPAMGATGFGYELARQFGHSIEATRAGLVPLTLSGSHSENYQDLSGVALPITASCGRQAFSNSMLLTHRGLSGPAILQISSYWQPGTGLDINLLPEIDAFVWMRQQAQLKPAAELKNVLADLIPKRFSQRLCELHLENRLMRQYNPSQLQNVASVLNRWPIVASGTEGYRTAEVTLGGVSTEQLNSATMESRLSPGLYFVGEVVDVTGHLGGYNFQWAWASGFAAGNAV